MAFNLSVSEAAKRLGVSSSRVYQLIDLGSLDAERIGRSWVVSDKSVAARVSQPVPAGRPKEKQLWGTSYLLMNRQYPVLAFEYDQDHDAFLQITQIIDKDRCPLGIVSARGAKASLSALTFWWKHRAIPGTREGLAARLADLGIQHAYALPFKSLGLSLSDQYWVQPAGQNIAWEDVNYFHNDFDLQDETWLSGVGLSTPDNTSEGELPKKWVIEAGQRTLLKGGSTLNQEPFNEAVATTLYRRLLAPDEYVAYELRGSGQSARSACPCFISDTEEYIPAYYVQGVMRRPNHLSEYRHLIECCVRMGIEDAELSLSKMLVTDDILANHDRHLRNFGIIRNVETLQCRMAPLFDSGNSLWCNVSLGQLQSHPTHFPSKPFYEDCNRQLRLVDDYSWFSPDALEGFPQQLAQILGANPLLADRIPYLQEWAERRIARILVSL